MKKATAILLICVLVLCLCSCKGKGPVTLELYDHYPLTEDMPQRFYLTTEGVHFRFDIQPVEGNWLVSEVNEEVFSYSPAVYVGSTATISFTVLQDFKKETLVFTNDEAGLKVTVPLTNHPEGIKLGETVFSDYVPEADYSELNELTAAAGFENVCLPEGAVYDSGSYSLTEEDGDINGIRVEFSYEGIAWTLRAKSGQMYRDSLDAALAKASEKGISFSKKKVSGKNYAFCVNDGYTEILYDCGDGLAKTLSAAAEVPAESVEAMMSSILKGK